MWDSMFRQVKSSQDKLGEADGGLLLGLFQLPLQESLESTGGTDTHAVSTENAARIRHVFIVESGHVALKPTLAPGQSVGMLHIVSTHLDTTPAHNALRIIADVERIILKDVKRFGSGFPPGEALRISAIVVNLVLNFRGIGQVDGRGQQLQNKLTAGIYPISVGVDDHIVGHRDDTGRLKYALIDDFNGA